MSLTRETDLAQKSRDRVLLNSVDAALKRISEGTFGQCLNCAHFFVGAHGMSEPFGTNRRLAVPKGGSPCTVTESANHRELGLGTKVRQRLANETTVNRAKQAAAMLTERLFLEHAQYC
jgi:hypothetical protein